MFEYVVFLHNKKTDQKFSFGLTIIIKFIKTKKFKSSFFLRIVNLHNQSYHLFLHVADFINYF